MPLERAFPISTVQSYPIVFIEQVHIYFFGIIKYLNRIISDFISFSFFISLNSKAAAAVEFSSFVSFEIKMSSLFFFPFLFQTHHFS